MNKDEWKKQIETEGISFNFEVNRWGSCQYSNCLVIFDLYNQIRKDLSIEDTLDVLDVTLNYDEINSWEDVQFELVISQLEVVDDAVPGRDETLEANGFKDQIELLNHLNNAIDPDGVFFIYKMMSWDLWSAANVIFSHFFSPNEFYVNPSPGVGPALNQDMQSDGYKTGIQCALLMEHCIVKEEESFVGFDT